ncbi:MAG: glycoside hydrolase family 3 N-terminal domain-containing protein [Pyrinomonadaceae bacterium]
MNINDLQSLTLEQKIGQLFFIGVPGDGIDAATAKLLADIQPGGVCLFTRNIRDPLQTRTLLDEIHDASRIAPFLSLDQEGGLVDRLRRILTPMVAPNKIRTTSDAAKLAEIISEAVRILGFNMNFAPVVDVIDGQRSAFSNGLHSRAFGTSPHEVVELAGEFLHVMQANGCMGCLKHFPGLGASKVDSHEELPSVSVSKDEFESVDLSPYKQLLQSGEVNAVMVAHAVYPEHHLQEADLNGKLLPSSLSSNIVTTLLRQELNFDGLVLTDDLEMGAIVKNYGIGEACVLAILAGEDMVSICAGVDSIYKSHAAITEAVETGRISEERLDRSLKRIFTAKSKLQKTLNFDADRLTTLSKEIKELNDRLN